MQHLSKPRSHGLMQQLNKRVRKRNICITTACENYSHDYFVNLCPDNEVVVGGYMYQQHKIIYDISWISPDEKQTTE